MQLRLSAFFIGAVVLSLGMTYLARWSARALKVYDHPNTSDPSKYHKEPVPLLGGLGIWMPIMLFGGLFLAGDRQVVAILVGATLMTVLGIIDDAIGLGYGVRLLAQTAVAGGLVYFSLTPDLVGPVWLSELVSLVWIVGLTNAFNLMDNLDGAAGGITMIVALTVVAFAVHLALPDLALMAAVVAGAAIGFTYFNRHPATVYLGSAGSFGAGFLISSLMILLADTIPSDSIQLMAFPVAMGFPIFDTTLVVATRLHHRRPLLTHDASCVTYRFFLLGLNRRQAVRLEYAMAALFCLLSWFVLTARTPLSQVAFVAWLVVLAYFVYRLATLPGERRIPA